MTEVRVELLNGSVEAIHIDGVRVEVYSVAPSFGEFVGRCRFCREEITISDDEYNARGTDGDWELEEVGVDCRGDGYGSLVYHRPDHTPIAHRVVNLPTEHVNPKG